MRRKFVAGNWKMNGSHSANAELLASINGARPFGCDVAVCVPFPYLSETAVALAAQAHALMESGEHVGKIMLDWTGA